MAMEQWLGMLEIVAYGDTLQIDLQINLPINGSMIGSSI